MSYINIQMKDGVCDTYVATPKNTSPDTKLPAVLFLMDGIGLRKQLESMADRLAEEGGFYVLQPNLFYRLGAQPLIPNVPEIFANFEEKKAEMFTFIRKAIPVHPPEVVIGVDIPQYFDYISKQENVADISKNGLGVVGYCFGGTTAVRTGCAYPELVKAVGSFHAGSLVTDQPNSPHLLLGTMKAECFFGHADNDQSNTQEQIEKLEAVLVKENIKHVSVKYPNAAHGYTMQDSPIFQKEASDKHWIAILDLFKRNLHNLKKL